MQNGPACRRRRLELEPSAPPAPYLGRAHPLGHHDGVVPHVRSISHSARLPPHGIRVVATAPGRTSAPERRIARGPERQDGREREWYQQIADQASTHRCSSGTGPWTSRPRRSPSSPPMRPPTSRGPCSLWLAATSDDRRLEQRRVPVPAGTDGRQTRHQSSLNCRRITPVSLGFSFSVSRVMLRLGAM